MSTAPGRDLALRLSRYGTPTAGDMVEVCSRLARAAATCERLAEEVCNGHPCQSLPTPYPAPPGTWERRDKLQAAWEARIDRQDAANDARMVALVALLPAFADGGRWTLDLSNGLAPRLVHPDGREAYLR